MGLFVLNSGQNRSNIPEVTPSEGLYEKEVEDLVWNNFELFFDDAVFPLRRQAVLPNGGKPDLLVLDKTGRPVVVEVKRSVERTQLSQALEYAGRAWDMSLDELAGLFELALRPSSSNGRNSLNPRRPWS